jgi:hypothetical protein
MDKLGSAGEAEVLGTALGDARTMDKLGPAGEAELLGTALGKALGPALGRGRSTWQRHLAIVCLEDRREPYRVLLLEYYEYFSLLLHATRD